MKLNNPTSSTLNEHGSRFDFVVKTMLGASGGIIIEVDRNYFEIKESRDGEFNLSIVTRRIKDRWSQLVTAMYSPNQSDRQVNLWNDLITVRSWKSEPWVLEGDFNFVRFLDERKGGDLNTRDRGHFNELIGTLGLLEIPLMKRHYTWSSMSEDPYMAKLDRVVVSPN